MSASAVTKVFCDTSFFYALNSKKDANHETAKNWAAEIERQKIACWTTWDVISKTLTLLVTRHSRVVAFEFMDHVEPTLLKADYGDEIRQAAKKTFRKFNKDHRISFCDCLSLHVVHDLLGNCPSLSFDHDFKILGLGGWEF